MFGLATLLGAVGGGMNLFGSLGAAKAQKANAATNFTIAMGNAEAERGNQLAALQLDEIRNLSALDNARLNMQFAELDAGARTRNADRLRKFAETRTAQGREAMRRQQRAFDGIASSQRAAVGASGVTGGGSPLEVMAESAGQMQLALKDAHDQISMERADSLTRAGMEEVGAARDRFGAQAELFSAERGYSLGQASNALGRMSAEANFKTARFGAQINQLSGVDQARGTAMSGIGGAFAGFGSLLDKRDRNKEISTKPF